MLPIDLASIDNSH